MIETVVPADIEDVLVISPKRFRDARGYFMETWNRRSLAAFGVSVDFVQDNQSFSERQGTIRGFHLQVPPHAQAKLVRCSRGAILDVSVDVRVGSPTFGRWCGVELNPENGLQVYIPAGFLHGFLTLTPDTEVQYKCSSYYEPSAEVSIHWNSAGVAWPAAGEVLTSPKDESAMSLSDFQSPYRYEKV